MDNNRSPILRFGILSDGKRSSYWRVRAGVARPELFLEREGFGKHWHLSLHESGQWHLKEGGKERISWARPDEVVPGYTLAVGIVQPVAVAHRDDAAPEGVELVTVPPEAAPTTFSVFMERPGANLNGWPGKNAIGTVFVGRIPLAGDAGTCCVVAHQEPLEPGKVTLPRPSDTELERMRDVAARGTLLTTVIGSLSDARSPSLTSELIAMLSRLSIPRSGVDLVDEEDVVSAWISLPRRIYLVTSTLQTVYDYGEVIWEGEPFEPIGRAAKVQGLAEEVDALRMIFLVNQRAMFEFVVTEASLREVEMRGRPSYTQWVYDVLDTWINQSAGQEPQEPGVTFDDRRFGNISRKDRRLLQDALDVGCDAFMTMERRLPTAAEFIQRTTRLRVMRPTTYWHLLDPWAALYY